MLVEIARLYRLHRKDEWFGAILLFDLLYPGQVQGGQGGIEMKVQAVFITGLAVTKAGILLAITVGELDLEPCAVIATDRQRIQVFLSMQAKRT